MGLGTTLSSALVSILTPFSDSTCTKTCTAQGMCNSSMNLFHPKLSPLVCATGHVQLVMLSFNDSLSRQLMSLGMRHFSMNLSETNLGQWIYVPLCMCHSPTTKKKSFKISPVLGRIGLASDMFRKPCPNIYSPKHHAWTLWQCCWMPQQRASAREEQGCIDA